MPDPKPEPAWSEWGRYTLSAVAGALVTAVAVALWFSEVAHTAADASASAQEAKEQNLRQDATATRIVEISNDIKVLLSRVVATQEAHNERIRALEGRVR